jgi:NAD(P)-dependent dehydrogenase (short-subunit alcohol dehydrogenase family)
VTRLEGKVALITGAGRGQGRAAALAMVAQGASVALTDLESRALKDVLTDVRAAGGEGVAVAGDIAEQSTVDALVTRTLDAFGRIDVLLNNAGISPSKPLDDYTLEDFDQIMHVNCWAQLMAIQKVLPAMRAAGGGSIINVSSVGGLVALPQLSAYCASKAAVIGLTRAVAYECAPDGIRCNAICPGGVDTPMAREVVASFPDEQTALALLTGRQMFKRFAHVDEITGLVVFLASDESSFMTGAAVPIEAGHSAW